MICIVVCIVVYFYNLVYYVDVIVFWIFVFYKIEEKLLGGFFFRYFFL